MSEEIDKLLAVIEAPDLHVRIPKRRYGGGSKNERSERNAMILGVFLKEHEIRPGVWKGIEICSLWRLYSAWHARFCPQRKQIPAFWFGRTLKAAGFQKYPTGVLGRSVKLLGMTKDSAARMKKWLKQNPDSQADRDRFAFPSRRRIPSALCPP